MKSLFAVILLTFSMFSIAQNNFTIENNQLVLPGQIMFETASAKIKLEESKPALEHIKAYLDAKSYVTLIRIEAHTDNNGKEESNLLLTSKRAKAVYEWLVNNGVDCKRLIGVAFGSSKPIADNSTQEGKAQNRRISIFNAELRNKAIGGMPADGGGVVAASCR